MDGGGVLQVGAPYFDDPLVFRLQTPEGGHQRVDGGQDPVLDRKHGGNVHGGGKGVVGGLAHIYVVVGVKELFARKGVAPARHHLVGVHVALGAGTGLPDHQRKVIVQRPGDDLVTGAGDGQKLFFGHALGQQGAVGPGRSLF